MVISLGMYRITLFNSNVLIYNSFAILLCMRKEQHHDPCPYFQKVSMLIIIIYNKESTIYPCFPSLNFKTT
uniref:Uncharacterized protein n=1 Tax=Arundo donax TaxID=35708 RepID=A0A0A9BKS4_ARUDO